MSLGARCLFTAPPGHPGASERGSTGNQEEGEVGEGSEAASIRSGFQTIRNQISDSAEPKFAG